LRYCVLRGHLAAKVMRAYLHQPSVAVTFLFKRNMRFEDHQTQQTTHIAEALPPGYAVVFSRWVFRDTSRFVPFQRSHLCILSGGRVLATMHPTSTINSHTVHSPHLIMCQCSFAFLWIFSTCTPSTLSSSQPFTGPPPSRHHFREPTSSLVEGC